VKKLKKKLVKSKSQKGVKDVAAMLRTIADRIEAKKIIFSQGEVETEVELPENLYFSIRAHEKELKRKGLSHRITIQIRWFDRKDEIAPLQIK
jgi:amphi-Trp domain-containing protein